MVKLAITIGRQYGSGGREIGLRLGELLGIRVLDKELLTIAAEKNGVSTDYLRRVDEKATNSLLYTLAMGSSIYGARNFGMDVPINDQLFITQSDIIKSAAEEKSTIFVGRCADYVLRNMSNRISFFLYANDEFRINHIAKRNGVDRETAIDMMHKTNKRRVNYYNFYTGKKWGAYENYHYCLDTSVLGIDGTAEVMAQIVRNFSNQVEEQA